MKSYILPKLIAIVGPTASGKTMLAIKLAKKFNGEIVSADSRQIYREMDIGTAKYPNSKIKNLNSEIHLIDIKNPNQSYTLAHYKEDALKAIRQIIKKGKMPFLVGGTGQYISAIIENWQIPEVKANKSLRARLERQLKRRGVAYLYKKLIALDPGAASFIDKKNPRRLIRALEVSMLSKKPFSSLRQKSQPLFQVLILGLNPDKKTLKDRIARRTKLMLKMGLVSEIKKLLKKYGSKKIPLNTINYREIIQHLKGQYSLPEAISQINKANWRYAKRQMTWFKRMPIVWITSQKAAEKAIEKFLKQYILLR